MDIETNKDLLNGDNVINTGVDENDCTEGAPDYVAVKDISENNTLDQEDGAKKRPHVEEEEREKEEEESSLNEENTGDEFVNFPIYKYSNIKISQYIKIPGSNRCERVTTSSPTHEENIESWLEKVEIIKKSNEEAQNVRDITISIMHAMGDSEFPLKENENLVINLLKHDIIAMLEDICKLKKTKNVKTRISISDLIFATKDHVGLLSRFLEFVTKKVEMSQFTRVSRKGDHNCTENLFGQEIESDGEEKEENINEIGEVDGEEGEYLEKKRKKLMTNDESLLEEVKNAFKKLDLDIEKYETTSDEKYDSRQKAFLKHIQQMSIKAYEVFHKARQVSFQRPASLKSTPSPNNSSTKKKSSAVLSLINWIGNPPLQGESAEIFLAFYAKEVIGEIVGSALIEKYNEPEGVFRNEQSGVEDCLQIRHYEEAMRKNETYRKLSRIFL